MVALALGIGLTTTMFSIVNGAILRGLPFDESDRILHIASVTNPRAGQRALRSVAARLTWTGAIAQQVVQ